MPLTADTLAQRTIKALRRLDRADRDGVVGRILRADPDLEPVVRVHAAVTRVRMPLRRDGVA